jgi:hypothetical protein
MDKCKWGKCGKPLAENSVRYCQKHLDKRTETQRLRVKKYKQQGLCRTGCGKKVVEGKTFCRNCLANIKNRGKEVVAERRLQGLCIDCGQPKSEKSVSRCVACLNRTNTYQKQRRAQHKIYGLYLHYYPRANSYKTGEGELRERLASARCYEPDAVVVAITLLSNKVKRIHKHDEIKKYFGLNGNEVFYPEERQNILEDALKLFETVDFGGINIY